jgi:uncharacterized protein YcbX
MRGTIASLWRHPVKGLTPEPLDRVELEAGAYFPNDRVFAVEVGPSGFDPAHPGHVSKFRFAVLARFPELAKVKTRLNDLTGLLSVGDETGFGVEIPFGDPDARQALARYLQAFLGGEADAPLKVLDGPGRKATPGDDRHHFMDNTQDGFVSAINLASLRAVEQAIGLPVDPKRFRANLYYDAGEAFIEDELQRGDMIEAGGARLQTMKTITRCIATHANPDSGARDIDMLGALQQHFGRATLGNYFAVKQGGRLAPGDVFGRAA